MPYDRIVLQSDIGTGLVLDQETNKIILNPISLEHDITSHTDTVITNPQTGEVIMYNATTGKFENADPSTMHLVEINGLDTLTYPIPVELIGKDWIAQITTFYNDRTPYTMSHLVKSNQQNYISDYHFVSPNITMENDLHIDTTGTDIVFSGHSHSTRTINSITFIANYGITTVVNDYIGSDSISIDSMLNSIHLIDSYVVANLIEPRMATGGIASEINVNGTSIDVLVDGTTIGVNASNQLEMIETLAHNLDSHMDVVITAPADGDYLSYTAEGNQWINTASGYTLSPLQEGAIIADDLLNTLPTDWVELVILSAPTGTTQWEQAHVINTSTTGMFNGNSTERDSKFEITGTTFQRLSFWEGGSALDFKILYRTLIKNGNTYNISGYTGTAGITSIAGNGIAINDTVNGREVSTDDGYILSTIVEPAISGKADIATSLAGYGILDPVALTTGTTFSGDVILNAAPTVDLQAATKKYVDDALTALPSELTAGNGINITDLVITTDNGYLTSTIVWPAIASKADLDSPTFIGTVTVPAPTLGSDAVTKTYVDEAIQLVIAGEATTIAMLTDTLIVDPQTGDALIYSAAGKWENTAIIDPVLSTSSWTAPSSGLVKTISDTVDLKMNITDVIPSGEVQTIFAL